MSKSDTLAPSLPPAFGCWIRHVLIVWNESKPSLRIVCHLKGTTLSLKQKVHQYHQRFHHQKDYTTHLVCRQLMMDSEVTQQQTSDGS